MSLLEICWGSGILQSLISLAGRDFAAVIRLGDCDKKRFCDTSVEAGKYTSWLGMLKRAWWKRGHDEDGRVWMVAGAGLKMMECL